MTTPYPLTFEPILKEKVWGGRRLGRLGKSLEEGRAYGESWEIADLDATSISGGGGGSARSVIDSGPLAGKTIRDAIRRWGGELLGARGLIAARQHHDAQGDPVFPLLIKFLDADEHLSVQTHPSPEYAAAHPGAHLKTESWYVLDAEPRTRPDGAPVDPSVFIGARPGISLDRFRDSIAAGTVAADLARHDATVGDCWTLPSGTVHALGAGVMVAEIQTPSDTTFRVYDWREEYGRQPRAMHVDEALRCIDFESSPSAAPRTRGLGRLADTAFYTIDRVDPGDGYAPPANACFVVIGVHGEGEIASPDRSFDAVPIAAGRTALVPAAIAAGVTLRGGDGFGVLAVRLGAG